MYVFQSTADQMPWARPKQLRVNGVTLRLHERETIGVVGSLDVVNPH